MVRERVAPGGGRKSWGRVAPGEVDSPKGEGRVAPATCARRVRLAHASCPRAGRLARLCGRVAPFCARLASFCARLAHNCARLAPICARLAHALARLAAASGSSRPHDGATRDGDSPPGRPREGSGRLLSALLTQCLTAAGRSLPGPPAWSCRRRAPAPVRPKTAQIDGRCRLRHHPRQSPPHILTDGCGARSQSNKGRRRRRHR